VFSRTPRPAASLTLFSRTLHGAAALTLFSRTLRSTGIVNSVRAEAAEERRVLRFEQPSLHSAASFLWELRFEKVIPKHFDVSMRVEAK